MLFQTPTFLIFLLLFLLGLPLFRDQARIVYCCLASYVFYGWWFPPYLLLLVGLTGYAYFFTVKPVTSILATLAVVCLGFLPLLVFKYTGFLIDNISLISGLQIDFNPTWALPIGISFITFTAIAYVLDVRSGKITAEPKFWNTALFISFFPQLVAGPILRGSELLDQIRHIKLDRSAVKFALFLFAIGALKKVGIADQIGPVVDSIYDSSNQISRPEAILAFYGFAVQIYGDFSGYTDMALALAALLSVNLPKNFDRPYLAGSIREFWRRWHMTLSRWLRDYLYVPLGGSKKGFNRTILAILITMVLGGLWHGAAWTFVVWGAMHGVLVAIEHLAEKYSLKIFRLPYWLKVILIFHFVGISWIFFRAPSFDRALDVFAGFFIAGDYAIIFQAPLVPAVILGAILCHPVDNFDIIKGACERVSASILMPFSVMLILIGAALAMNNPGAFIYFDF